MFIQGCIAALLFLISFTAHAFDCIPTPHRTTGTHYEPVTIEKADISKGVIFSGQVVSAPDCLPVASAKVSHWQAGEDGRYADRLRAYMYTDDEGRFRFETEWPNLRSPHIHFIVEAEGFEILETQWIGGRRQTEIDFWMVLSNSE